MRLSNATHRYGAINLQIIQTQIHVWHMYRHSHMLLFRAFSQMLLAIRHLACKHDDDLLRGRDGFGNSSWLDISLLSIQRRAVPID